MIDFVLVTDLSKYQDPTKVPYKYLREHGFRLGIPKYSMGGGIDGNARAHSYNIKAAGMDLGGYHWCDPTQDWNRQAEYFLNLADELKPQCLMLDVEQWWASWTKYWASLRGEIPNSEVPRLSETQIIANMVHVANKITSSGILPKSRIMVYTARWFTNIYPGLGPAIKDLGLHIVPAHYRTNINGVNWKIQEYDWNEFYNLVPKDQNPLMPVGGPSEYLWWQFTSAPKFNGVRLDCGLYNGSVADYERWIDSSSPTPPPVDWEDAYQTLLAEFNALKEKQDVQEETLLATGARLEQILAWAKNIDYKE